MLYRLLPYFFLIISLISCIVDPTEPVLDQYMEGAVLLRNNSYIYILGGIDESDTIYDTVYRSQINSDGTISTPTLIATLPEPLAYAAGFSIGEYLYLCGGLSTGGAISAIYYTKVRDNGSLGIGVENNWEVNLRDLPEMRYAASVEVYDGRIFLIGGTDGNTEYDTIIHSRIYQDGQIGQWYISPEHLQENTSFSSSAIYNNRLWIACGKNSESVSDSLLSYEIGEYGLLSDMENITLDNKRYNSLLYNNNDKLYICGGKDDSGYVSSTIIISDDSITSSDSSSEVTSLGDYYIKTESSIYSLDNSSTPVVLDIDFEVSQDLQPIYPGSGMIPTITSLRWMEVSGLDVSLNGDIESSKTYITPPIVVEASLSNGQTANYTYSEGLISLDFLIDSTYSAISRLINGIYLYPMTETYITEFEIEDSSSFTTEFTSSGDATFSIFESDILTPVVDDSGIPILYDNGVDIEDRSFLLNAGRYYIIIEKGSENSDNSLIFYPIKTQ